MSWRERCGVAGMVGEVLVVGVVKEIFEGQWWKVVVKMNAWCGEIDVGRVEWGLF